MAKKIVITRIAIMFLSLFCGVCFANEEMKNMTTNMGGEINKSLDKAGQDIKNMTNDVMSGRVMNKVENGINDVGNKMQDGVDSVRNGTARTYNVVRTDAGTTTSMTGTGMGNNTFIWVIMAVLAVMIISAVWLYVAQNNERRY